MGASKNRGTPKSSILIGFSIINHPFWGTIILGNIHILSTLHQCSIVFSGNESILRSFKEFRYELAWLNGSYLNLPNAKNKKHTELKWPSNSTKVVPPTFPLPPDNIDNSVNPQMKQAEFGGTVHTKKIKPVTIRYTNWSLSSS